MRFFTMPAAGKTCFVLMLMALSGCEVVVDESGQRPRGPRPYEEPGICTREYEPVCARRGNDRQTFSNGCLADASGYRVIRDGECRRGGGGDGDDRFNGDGDGGGRFDRPREPQYCTREYRPVCAVQRGDTRTFPNACEARAADYRVVDDGPC